jgi:peptidoglycan/LPS O-acetylase OafA/YrhL
VRHTLLPSLDGTMGSVQYRADIDGLRAFAVLSVVVFHAFPNALPGGFVGVDVFFVISGYLITRDIVTRGDAFSVVDFYARRARRILPALLTVFAGIAAAGAVLLFDDEYRSLLSHIAASAAFVQNFKLLGEAGYFDVASSTKPMLHLWSLAIEEQFYLLWPWVMLLARRRALLVTLGLLAGSFAFGLTLDSDAAYYLPHARWWQIMAGAALALVDVRIGARTARVASAVGLCLLALGCVALMKHGYPGLPALLPTAGAFLLIASGSSTGIAALLSRPAMTFIGRISYPLYLWHWPALSLLFMVDRKPGAAALAAVLALSLLLAVLTWRFVERPLRRASWSPLPLAGSLLAACVAAFVVSVLMPPGKANDLRYVSIAEPCEDVKADYCLRHGNPAVAVIGDSHAYHLMPGLLAEAPERGWLLLANSSCPPLVGVKVIFPGANCGTKDQVLLTHVSAMPVETVVLAFFGSYALDTNVAADDVRGSGPRETVFDYPGSNKAELLLKGLEAAVTMLHDKHVVLVLDVPELPFMPRDCLARAGAAPQIADCSVRRSDVLQRQRQLREAFAELAARHANVRVFDPLDLLCSADRCAVDRGNMMLYRDSNHLSDRGSRIVARGLLPMLGESSSRAALRGDILGP